LANDEKAAKELYAGLLEANKEIKRLRWLNCNLKFRYKALLAETIESKKEIIAFRKKLDTSFDKTSLWINEYKKLKDKKVKYKWIGMSIKFGVSHVHLRTEAEVWISPFRSMKGLNFFITSGYEYHYKSTGNFYWLAGVGYRF
jgi:hypothetical protein